MFLAAAVMAAPEVMGPVLNCAGRVISNWIPATGLPSGSNVTGTVTEVPAWPEAVPRVNAGAAEALSARRPVHSNKRSELAIFFVVPAMLDIIMRSPPH